MVEADESDRSFLKLRRDVAVVTSVELDHHATYARSASSSAPSRVRARRPGSPCPARACELPTRSPAVSYGIDDGDLRAERVELLPLGSRFTVDGVPVRAARCPGGTTS